MGTSAKEAAEWQRGVLLAACFIHACQNEDIDPRGPVHVRDDSTPYYACSEHWEGIMRVLGEQVERREA